MAVSGCSLVLGTSVLPGEGRVLAAELAADGSAEGSFVEAAASRAGAGIFVAAVVGSFVVADFDGGQAVQRAEIAATVGWTGVVTGNAWSAHELSFRPSRSGRSRSGPRLVGGALVRPSAPLGRSAGQPSGGLLVGPRSARGRFLAQRPRSLALSSPDPSYI